MVVDVVCMVGVQTSLKPWPRCFDNNILDMQEFAVSGSAKSILK